MKFIRLILFGFIITISFLAKAQERSDSIFMHYLDEQHFPTTSNNKVYLLMSGREKFIDLFDAIKKAKQYIHLEYFNFRNDSIANALFDLLAEKAKEGVKVRAMFDAFGNWSNNKPLKKKQLKHLRKSGIEIVKFDPINFPYINHASHRDHQKIVVIDGKIGYTGGMNIADYYINGLPKLGPWHDMHVHIEGDAVRYLQGIFLTMWNKQTGQHLGGSFFFPDTPQIADSLAKNVSIVNRSKEIRPKGISHAYAKAIESAQREIHIVNPYFVPTPSIRKAIKKALNRGVKIEIMIPAKSDIPFTPDASFNIAYKLMKEGVNIYLFNGGFHHSKIMMVDGLYCTVGSANLDSRSLRYDYETNAFIFDSKITHQLDEMFERDKKNSTLLTQDVWKQHSLLKKCAGWLGNHLFTLFL